MMSKALALIILFLCMPSVVVIVFAYRIYTGKARRAPLLEEALIQGYRGIRSDVERAAGLP